MNRQVISQADLEQAEKILKQDLGGQVWDVHVEVLGEGVILHGLARSFHAKQLAQHKILKLLNAPVLANLIEVRRLDDRHDTDLRAF